MYRIGIDVGGTNIAAGLVDSSMRIIDRVSRKTDLPTTAERIIEDVSALIRELMTRNALASSAILNIGVGVPCTANVENGCMEDADHLGFPGGPLVSLLEERFRVPVVISNDANAAAWGEYKVCGYDAGSFILVTLGTGIGGGIILDGRLWTGTGFAAGELGHMVICAGGAPCGCGRKGCLEAYASATALIGQAKQRMASDDSTLLWRLCGGDIRGIEAKTVFDGAKEQDELCRKLLEEYTTYLSEGLANIINLFQPAVLCIGGGVSAAGEQLLAPVREKTSRLVLTGMSGRKTKIILAQLGNDAGIIGAAMLGY